MFFTFVYALLELRDDRESGLYKEWMVHQERLILLNRAADSALEQNVCFEAVCARHISMRVFPYGAVRGALRYFDGDVVVLDEGSGLESEGVEICTFSSQGSFYMLYTPVEPLLLAARQVEGASGLTFVESDLQDSAVQRQLLSLQLTLDQDDEEDEG